MLVILLLEYSILYNAIPGLAMYCITHDPHLFLFLKAYMYNYINCLYMYFNITTSIHVYVRDISYFYWQKQMVTLPLMDLLQVVS